jgi:hypothetical protein
MACIGCVRPWFAREYFDKIWSKRAFMEQKSLALSLNGEFASDLLRGADRIADFLFGDPQQRRKVYHLARTSRLPVFRLGSLLCARKSTLLDWVARQERREPTAWNSTADEVVRRA